MLKRPFYYGWIIVAVALLIGVTEAGVFQNILAVFLKPMCREFGWSRAEVTGAIAIGSIGGGIASPFVGHYIDRYGPRVISFISISLLSIGLLAMSSATKLWHVYLFFGTGRLLAVGILSLVVTVVISNWFIKYRTRAMGIAWLGGRIGSAILPPFVQFNILSYGLRMAWVILGLTVFVTSALPSLFFLKRRPEDFGLRPDGEREIVCNPPDVLSPADSNSHASKKLEERDYTRGEVIRNLTFWILSGISCLHLFVNAGINFHIFPFLTDQQISGKNAVLILSTIAISSALGSILWGILAEHMETTKVLLIEFVISAIIFLSFFKLARSFSSNGLIIWGLFFLGALYGIISGGLVPLLNSVWAEYYGRANIGSIFSLVSPLRLTANASGPFVGGLCYDFLGNYNIIFYIFIILFIISSIFCAILPKANVYISK